MTSNTTQDDEHGFPVLVYVEKHPGATLTCIIRGPFPSCVEGHVTPVGSPEEGHHVADLPLEIESLLVEFGQSVRVDETGINHADAWSGEFARWILQFIPIEQGGKKVAGVEVFEPRPMTEAEYVESWLPAIVRNLAETTGMTEQDAERMMRRQLPQDGD